MQATLQRYFAAVILITSALSAAAGAPAPLRDKQQWFEIQVSPGGQPIVLPVTLGRQSLKFLLSNSDDHSFDEALRPIVGNVIGTKRLRKYDDNISRLEIVKTPVLSVGGCDVRPLSGEYSFLWDLTPIRQSLEEDIRGLLGVSFLRGRLVQFDFDAGIVRLSEGQVNPDTLGAPWPLRVTDRGHLWVDNLQVGNRAESFEVSLGDNGFIHVHNWLFNALKREGQLREFRRDMTKVLLGPATPSPKSEGLLSQISWGAITQNDVRIETDVSNSLGLGFLSRFVLTIDADGGCLYLRPGKKAQANRPDMRESTGFSFDRQRGRFVITRVRDGSRASEAGMLAGDLIESVNNVSCQDMRPTEFAWRLDESRGARLKLTLNRHGALIDVSFDMPLTTDPGLFVQEGEEALPVK